jgi:hypothetical protein
MLDNTLEVPAFVGETILATAYNLSSVADKMFCIIATKVENYLKNLPALETIDNWPDECTC